MHRFYLPGKPDGNSLAITDPELAHHIKDVLRLKVGDAVEIFDGSGRVYSCRIKLLPRGSVELEVVSELAFPPIQPKIVIGCSVPRNVKMDEIVDKLSQLGVDSIVPLETERVVVKLENTGQKLARWRKVAQAAAEQSRRANLMRIGDILDLEAFIELTRNYDLKLIPTLEGTRRALWQIIEAAEPPASVAVMIGPEGDFSPGEVARAIEAGYIPVTLGEQVLRVDTAAIAVAGYLRLALSAG